MGGGQTVEEERERRSDDDIENLNVVKEGQEAPESEQG